MGHDVHFLERLGRISGGQVDLAMSLYRDPELVREIFARSKVPDGSTRVAVSLADPVDGPFVLLERGGRFVTCLGPGMRTDDLPLITRAKLDSVAAQLATLRERLELAARAADGTRAPDVAPGWRTLVREPERLTREDVAGLVAWLPTIRGLVYSTVLGSLPRITEGRILLRERRSQHADVLRLAELVGRRLRYTATMIQLLLLEPDALVQLAGTYEQASELGVRFAGETVSWCDFSCAALMTNGLARGGKAHLPALKRLHEGHLVNAIGLGALALSRPKHRAEILKFLDRRTTRLDVLVTSVLSRADEAGEEALEAVREHAFTSLAGGRAAMPWGRPEEVPVHVAIALAVNEPLDLSLGRTQDRLVSLMPLLAAARPEDLYPPAEVLPALEPSSPIELAYGFVDRYERVNPRVPVKVDATPGRNDPCSCGSGRKYKKCCGA